MAVADNQITPAIVREAYSLLRQSIIHVEQDDINFDDDEDHDIAGVVNGNGHATGGMTEEDESMMDAADIAALDAAESSFAQQQAAAASSSGAVNGGSAQPNGSGKKKMRITCKSLELTRPEKGL